METTLPISKKTIIAAFKILLQDKNINPKDLAIGTVSQNFLMNTIPTNCHKCYCYPEESQEIIKYFHDNWGVAISDYHTPEANIMVFYKYN